MVARVVILLAALGIVHCKLLNSCNFTKSFVDGHNERRLQLAKGLVHGQPPASAMKHIVWDDELAKKAQDWASKTTHSHNPDRTIPSGRFQTGENIYEYGTTGNDFNFDPELAMDSWWGEYVDYKYGTLSNNDFAGPAKIGHYTQMAWADSDSIGCGVYEYREDGWDNFYVVCNYGPPGNWIGEAPYKAGGPSDQLVCPSSGCTQSYGNQC